MVKRLVRNGSEGFIMVDSGEELRMLWFIIMGVPPSLAALWPPFVDIPPHNGQENANLIDKSC